MDSYEFVDALTGDAISQSCSTGEVTIERGVHGKKTYTSIFFPGCSMINYAMPLVASVYETLKQHGEVDGISLLCCGKILSFEPDGDTIRADFEEDFKEHIVACGIQRMVCACPNCVKALREAFIEDERTKHIELVPLPQVFAHLGYKIDRATAAEVVLGDASQEVLLCVHDSCPDREYGQFADGLRAVMEDDLWVDPPHTRKHSICCGSLPRAAGKTAAADKCANTNGEEALACGADAIVVACMSCAFQLNMAQAHIQCVHFLELLYSWRIDWSQVGAWMKLRFLFNETMGAIEKEAASGRHYECLGAEDSTSLNPENDVAINDCFVDDEGL